MTNHAENHVACPECGVGGLNIEHRWAIVVDADISDAGKSVGYVCPLLAFLDAGQVDENGGIEWWTVARFVGARRSETIVDDDAVVAPGSRTVLANSTELRESELSVACRACGWRQAEHEAPERLEALFQHIRRAVAPYRPGSPGRHDSAIA